MKKLKKMLKEQKGFTLVELVVVIAILGILIAIAVPKYNDITRNSKIKAHQATARTIMSAIIMAEAENPGEDLTKDKIEKFLTASTTIEIAKPKDDAWTVQKTTSGEWEIFYNQVKYYPVQDNTYYEGEKVKKKIK